MSYLILEFTADFSLTGDGAGGNIAAAVCLKLVNMTAVPKVKSQVLINPYLQALDFNTPSYQKYSETGFFLDRLTVAENWFNYGIGRGQWRHLAAALGNNHTSSAMKQSRFIKDYLGHRNIPLMRYPIPYRDIPDNYGQEDIWKEIEETFLNPYFAPLMADNLTNLAPVMIVATDSDILRDDAYMFAKRCLKFRVRVILKCYRYSWHGAYKYFERLYPFSSLNSERVFSDVRNVLKSI